VSTPLLGDEVLLGLYPSRGALFEEALLFKNLIFFLAGSFLSSPVISKFTLSPGLKVIGYSGDLHVI
jgi:hypothetical protein